MSFKTSTRITSSLRSASRLAQRVNAPVVARRMNSSGGHKAPSGDMAWMLGSAAFFLPLGAWVMTRGGGDHGHGEAHPSALENQYAHGKQEDQHGRSGLEAQFQEPDHMKNDEKPEGNTGGADNAENAPGVNPEKEASQQADVIKSEKEATAVEEQGGAQNKLAAEKARGNDGAKSEEKKDEKTEEKEEKKEEKSEDKEEKTEEKKDSDEGDAPSEQAIKDSLHQAEEAAVPRAAMDAEEKSS